MKLKSFAAAVAGTIVAFITIYLMEMIGMNLFPMKQKLNPTNYEELKLLLSTIPVGAFMMVAIGHGLAVFLGALTINKIHQFALVGFLVMFILILLSTAVNLLALPHPTWFMITDLTLVIGSGLASWRLLKWK